MIIFKPKTVCKLAIKKNKEKKITNERKKMGERERQTVKKNKASSRVSIRLYDFFNLLILTSVFSKKKKKKK